MERIIRLCIFILAAAGFVLFATAPSSYGRSSVNIPASSRLYDDFERSDVNTTLAQKRSWFAFDIDYPVTDSLRLGAGGGYEEADGAVEPASSSPVAWVRLEYSF